VGDDKQSGSLFEDESECVLQGFGVQSPEALIE
jgi:hypothetical protein